MSKESGKRERSKNGKSRVVIGLTGGLASGKSLAALNFASLGAEIIDADEIAHELLKENDGIKREVVNSFKDVIAPDGEIDRKKLGEKVFHDTGKLKELCRILHPEIICRIKKRVEASRAEVVVVDAPLLFEAALDSFVDKVIVVSACEEKQIERAVSRGISEHEAKMIIQNQMPLSEKERSADYVIDNSGDRNNLKKGVDELWKKVREKKT